MAERVISMYEAIAEAIGQEMERDERVFAMGEDVGGYGGIFGATTGLWKRFGDERIMDTPISEMGFVGAAVGAALEGMRPIAEVMFIDFIGACFDQVLNHFSKIQYMSGGQLKVPVVIMTGIGGGYNDAAQHSQCLYSIFGHIPGIKVVIPCTPYDAKGLMAQAIRDDNPVMYFFHKGLMGLPWMSIIEATWAPVPEEPYTIPFGMADIKREGTDVTLVAVSMMIHRSLEAAEKLADEGISVEVIDLRTLVPLDKEAVVNSVKKTHRLLVVDEDYLSYGMSGEIAAVVAGEALDYLDMPPKRLAVPDVPIPYSNTLEDFVIPNAESIAQAVRELVG
jgi:pyruvate/2-oxoglutarate/acetoin dehydrogenase E1 component